MYRMYRKLPIMICTLAVGLAGIAAASDGGEHGRDGGQRLSDQNITRAKLQGPAINGETPNGTAVSRSNDGNNLFRVEVEDVNLPDGTVLTVFVSHEGNVMRAGEIKLMSGSAELERRARDGDQVPQPQAGDVVFVRQGHMTILAGVFF